MLTSNPYVSDMFGLAGRTALITGAAGSIGLVIARTLGLAGARVIINDINASACEPAVAGLKAQGIDARAAAFNVSKRDEVLEAAATLEKNDIEVDILVSNAGVQVRKLFGDIQPEEWQAVMDTHLGGAFLCGQAFIPAMSRRGFGRAIFMSSVAGQAALPNISAYVAAKGAISSLTRALAVEYGSTGVTCNALAPGFIETEFTSALQNNSEFQTYLQSAVPAKRWGTPLDIAPAVVYLASGASSFINGHTLTIDGGLLSRM